MLLNLFLFLNFFIHLCICEIFTNKSNSTEIKNNLNVIQMDFYIATSNGIKILRDEEKVFSGIITYERKIIMNKYEIKDKLLNYGVKKYYFNLPDESATLTIEINDDTSNVFYIQI